MEEPGQLMAYFHQVRGDSGKHICEFSFELKP